MAAPVTVKRFDLRSGLRADLPSSELPDDVLLLLADAGDGPALAELARRHPDDPRIAIRGHSDPPCHGKANCCCCPTCTRPKQRRKT